MAVRRLNHAVLYVHGLERTSTSTPPSVSRSAWRYPAGRLPARTGLGQRPRPGPVRHRRGSRPRPPGRPGLYHLAWEVGTLADLIETRQKLLDAGALVGESDHRVSKSLYAKDPSGIEFEVMWRVPAEDWDAEMADGDMILPLDLDAAIARWGQDQATGAAAGSD